VLREYIYVEDMVDAYLFLGKNITTHYKSAMPEKGRAPYGWAAYNIGGYGAADALADSPNIKSVSDVIELVGSKLGTGLRPTVIPKPANFIEIPDQYLDSSKLGLPPAHRTGRGRRSNHPLVQRASGLAVEAGAPLSGADPGSQGSGAMRPWPPIGPGCGVDELEIIGGRRLAPK
jgi:hypothetical protein